MFKLSTAQTGFTAQPSVRALRVKACIRELAYAFERRMLDNACAGFINAY